MTFEKLKLLLWLFKTDFFISSFTFGGGYVVLPMIRKYFIEQKHLFSEDELMDMSAVAQSSPGAIAINLAVLCGKKVAGWPGIFVAGIAAVLPPLLILSAVSACYRNLIDNPVVVAVLKGMEAGVAALIADVVWYMSHMIVKKKETLLSGRVISFSKRPFCEGGSVRETDMGLIFFLNASDGCITRSIADAAFEAYETERTYFPFSEGKLIIPFGEEYSIH